MRAVYIYAFIIVLLIISLVFYVTAFEKINCSRLPINSCIILEQGKRYLGWAILLTVTSIGLSIIMLIMSIVYYNSIRRLYNGWLLYGITLLLFFLTTGVYFFSAWAAQSVVSADARNELERLYERIILGTIILILANAIFSLANTIFLTT